MKKKIALMVAFGCLGASAASVHYDILGRKGSKMNSPMVYKNVDYTKTQKQKQEKVGSSLETRALQRTGMGNNVAAIEGSFRSYQSNNRFSIKRHYYSNPDNCNNSQCSYNWNGYKSRANEVFIRVNEDFDVSPNYETFDGLTHSEDNGIYTFSWGPSYEEGGSVHPYLPSPFSADQYILYMPSSRLYSAWLRRGYTDVLKRTPSYTGAYMSADALPVTMDGYPVKYVRTDGNETFNPTPGYEVRDSWTYYFLGALDATVTYVGKKIEYGDPASKTPQVYVGVRNDRMGKGSSSSYSSLAKSLDNFIYRYRTIEIVPAGNYGVDGTTTQGNVCKIGQAANAVTVGAIDPVSNKIADYSSTKNYDMGSRKPEIYNYTHAVVGAPGIYRPMWYGIRRVYTQNSSGREFVYEPVVYGTETAAALLASLVNATLSYNPFYRWHPEVVKAFLLTSDGRAINPPYPPNTAMKTGPSIPYVYFDDQGSNTHFDYDSRYWNGSIDNLKTRTDDDGKKEIWFVTKNLGTSTKPASAAISWLSSGTDIANIGHIPQDFDLSVYGSNSSNYERYLDPHAKLDGLNFDNPGEYIGGSFLSYNSYEKVTIASNYKYLIFRISMFSEDDRSENKGQVVMGFNMASADKQNYN